VVVPDAYAACQRLAAAHYENFPVASRLMPKESRPHVAAIYAFARHADDLADEGNAPPAQRIAELEAWQWRLHEAVAGRVPADGTTAEPIFTALADTIQRFNLDVQLFEDLLSAFCQDAVVTRYERWSDLLDYCRRSANPIGRLVLRVCRYRDVVKDRQSDAICTALQLTNFWQDLAIDWSRGRLYVPRDIYEASGAPLGALDARVWTIEWQQALEEAGRRTRALFVEGRPIVDGVQGRLRHELRATWLGGMRVLERLEAEGYDVFHHRPKLGMADAALIGWRSLRWKKGAVA
jgi:squalene synthase HpnC